MYSVQNVNQVFKNKRTVSAVYIQQRKQVLFVILFMCIFPMTISCILGEISKCSDTLTNKFLLWDTSKYTVVFDTSYGRQEMDLEAAIACMLPTMVPTEYEKEAIKAQAILLRSEILYMYKNSNNKKGYIYLEKNPFKKIYFTFAEQKKIWKEKYPENVSTYEHAVMETAGMYIKRVNEDNKEDVTVGGWFRVSGGNTREGVCCEDDYKAVDYYNEKSFGKEEFNHTIVELYRDEQYRMGENILKEIKNVFYKDMEGEGYTKGINFMIVFEDEGQAEYTINSDILCRELELQSPYIEDITETKHNIIITVKGVGHGSGMSLFEANELAKEGKDYEEILKYFFTNIAIDKIE